ncbi:hypothetical protein EON62_01360, partial [archaeon]
MAAVEWLREAAETYLEFGAPEWNGMMADDASADRNGAAVAAFMSGAVPKGTPLYIFTTSTEREVPFIIKTTREEEVEEEEEEEVTA